MRRFLFILLFIFLMTTPVLAQTPEPTTELQEVQPVEVVESNETEIAWEYVLAGLVAGLGLLAFVYDTLVRERLERRYAEVRKELAEQLNAHAAFVDPVTDFLGEPVIAEIEAEVKRLARLVAKTTLQKLDLDSREERIDYLVELTEQAFKSVPVAAPSSEFIRGAVLELVEEFEDLVD